MLLRCVFVSAPLTPSQPPARLPVLRSLPSVSLETEQGAAYQKSLRVQNAVRLAKMTPQDDRLLGLLFASCAKAAGGEHEARRGDSINEAALLSMTAEDTPQTIHADDVVQSLAIIYNASNVAVMGPEFLNHRPVVLTGVGIKPSTPQGVSVHCYSHLQPGYPYSTSPSQPSLSLFVPRAQNRTKLIQMWTALEGSEANPDVKGSGILQPGDAVFFNPTHPHRGPRAPFPPTEGGGAGSEGAGGASGGKRTMIFMSACHTKGSSEGGAIFASAPAAPRQGRVWRDAFKITEEECAKVMAQSVIESPRKKPRKRAANPDAAP